MFLFSLCSHVITHLLYFSRCPIDTFKNNLPDKEKEFYALSTAQFLTYGKERMNKSFQIITDNYIDFFTEFYLNKGRKYVQAYLDLVDD